MEGLKMKVENVEFLKYLVKTGSGNIGIIATHRFIVKAYEGQDRFRLFLGGITEYSEDPEMWQWSTSDVQAIEGMVTVTIWQRFRTQSKDQSASSKASPMILET